MDGYVNIREDRDDDTYCFKGKHEADRKKMKRMNAKEVRRADRVSNERFRTCCREIEEAEEERRKERRRDWEREDHGSDSAFYSEDSDGMCW